MNAIQAQSKPNVASVSLLSTLRNDLTTGLTDGLTLYPTGSIIASGSKYKSFRLESLYFACKLYIAQPLIALPEGCSLSAVAFDQSGNAINEVTFSYSPGDVLKSVMVKKDFGMDLDGVYGVNITITDAGLGPVLALVNIDDLEICGYV